eukprot:TRINITY_DN9298_c0_g1_i2.p1 TRINITY_DN9298_c0_g1~~TRINITY_DN9298_c0_g1_i2.p1  ORF type:complete len:250 (+),score=62.29 TRINITY_DN9298_c0_g1_i2:80-829(+)
MGCCQASPEACKAARPGDAKAKQLEDCVQIDEIKTETRDDVALIPSSSPLMAAAAAAGSARHAANEDPGSPAQSSSAPSPQAAVASPVSPSAGQGGGRGAHPDTWLAAAADIPVQQAAKPAAAATWSVEEPGSYLHDGSPSITAASSSTAPTLSPEVQMEEDPPMLDGYNVGTSSTRKPKQLNEVLREFEAKRPKPFQVSREPDLIEMDYLTTASDRAMLTDVEDARINLDDLDEALMFRSSLSSRSRM